MQIVLIASAAAEAKGLPEPGFWVPLLNQERVDLSYLNAPQLTKILEFDEIPHVRVQDSIHAGRVAALRNWLVRDALIAKQFSDPMVPDDGPQWLLQFSAAGYALEGHALIFIFRVDGAAVTEVAAFGFWTEAPKEGVLASVGPATLLPVTAPPWLELMTDGSLKRPQPDSYQDYRVAGPRDLSTFRKGLRRYWGRMPDGDGLDILLASRALKKTTRVPKDVAINLIAALDKELPSLRDLNAKLVKQDFATLSSKGVAAFRALWEPAINLTCESVSTLSCGPVPLEQSIYPQSRIEWGVGLGPHGNYVNELRPWAKPRDRAERRLVSATDADTVTTTDVKDVFILDFELGREIWLDGRREFARRYIGPLVNGRATGNGTLYLGYGSNRVDWEKPRLRSVTAQFANGLLDGPATFFLKDGTMERRGVFASGKRHGPFDMFRANGTPLLRATYKRDRIVDGPILRTELNQWTLQPWRIFEGRIENGKEVGAWHYIPILQELRAGDRRIVSGHKASYVFADGSILSGDWDNRRQVFKGPCVLQVPSGRLDTTCDGIRHAEYPFDGPGKFLPNRTDVGQELQDVVVVDGAFEFYRLERVKTKDKGWLRRLGNEGWRWVNDAGEAFEDFICGIGESLADDCNVNVAVHITADGDVTIGEFPGDKPAPRPSTVFSEETIRWFVANEPIEFEAFVPLEFDSMPNFDIPKLGSEMPEVLGRPAFPPGYVRPPTLLGIKRPNIMGSPNFGARRARKGGAFVYHTGIDYWTSPGDTIVSPINGKVLYTVKHPDGLNTVVIGSDKVHIRILYVQNTPPPGTPVTQGLGFATAGNLSVRPRYAGVPNHVHMVILKPNSKWTYSIDGRKRIFMGWPYPLQLIP